MRALPTLTQLRHLIALSETQHFGRAAEAVLVTQSTMSASIKELEANLGGTLVERTKRQVRMTSLGDQVVARARDIITQTEDLVGLVESAQGPLSGTLRIGLIPTIGPFLLPRLWPALKRDYPALNLEITEDQSARLTDALGQGTLDAALLAFPYAAEPFETLKFARDPFLVTLPQQHPLLTKERVTARDLKSEKLLLLEQGHCLRDHILGSGGIFEATLTDTMKATSLLTLVQMVDAGFGLTLLPKMAVDAGILRGTKLQVRPLETARAAREIGIAYRKTNPRKADLGLLAGLMRDELGTPIPKRRSKS